MKYNLVLLIQNIILLIDDIFLTSKYELENIQYKQKGIPKIDIFAFIEDGNIGDPVIGETAKFLVQNICNKNNIDATINLHRLFPVKNYKYSWITKLIRLNCREKQSNSKRFLLYAIFRLYCLFNRNFKNYYTKILKDSDITIFGGGGMLKYFTQDFWVSDLCIIEYCDKHNIPVYFNAVGIEGYDDKNFTSRLIKKLLNKKCITKVTTRDDIDALNQFLPNKEHAIVGDPALYSKELYGSSTKTDVIGINTIRSGIFNANEFETTEQELIDFYCEMIKRLDADGLKWQLFTNGVNSDYSLALKILRHLNINPSSDNLTSLPKSGEELAKTISGYKGVIAGRMHAHIIATSYDIPTIGQIWNKKIKWFSKHLGCEERFFYPDELNNYDLIYNRFLQAIKEGNSKLNTQKLKEATVKELENIILTTLNKDI